jgi:hypothetical protein
MQPATSLILQMDELNPFNMVFRELWVLAEASVPLSALIKKKNQVRYDSDTVRNPLKDKALPADLPELHLLPANITNANLGYSSCASNITAQYTFIIVTGDKRAVLANNIQFALFSALQAWQTILYPLEWRNTKFVKRANWLGANVGLSNQDANRDISGWSAIWTAEVEMHFSKQDLINFNEGV